MQESQFVTLEEVYADESRHFPLNALFDSTMYRKLTKNLPEEIALKLDKLQQKFQEVRIPFQILETNNRSIVAIVFERINRRGQPLDTLQLLSAWTWNDDFDLKEKFEQLKEELEPYGFSDIGENINLLLKIISSVITGNAAADSLMDINGITVRDSFSKIINGIKGSIDFLRANLFIENLNNLPYDNILVPLSVFFAAENGKQLIITDLQRAKILKWFWKTCLSKRYSAGTVRKINSDIEEILNLKNQKDDTLGSFSCKVDSSYFIANNFQMNTVNTKTFILLLAQCSPRSFISGAKLNLATVLKDYNRKEFHHLFPRSYLRSLENIKYNENCLANICFLSKADNNKLKGNAPSIYKSELPVQNEMILSSAFCHPDLLFNDQYERFIEDRAGRLQEFAEHFIS